MTFKSKLAFAFSSVLALTIIVVTTNWWGLRMVIHTQRQITYLSSTIEKSFQEITDIEQHYHSTRDSEDAQLMKYKIEQLRHLLKSLPQSGSNTDSESHRGLFSELDRYASSFFRANSSAITMRAMKSRMSKESERLLENAQNLVDRTMSTKERVPASHLAYRISLILINGNSFLLETTPASRAGLMRSIESLLQFTSSTMSLMPEEIQKLELYRILKAAKIYRETVASFIKEKQRLDNAEVSMKNAYDSFSRILEVYLTQQQRKNEENITTLQSISLLISFAAICIGIAAVLFLSNMITHPLNELKKSARNIVAGNLDTFVNSTGSDDIGELGSIFNQMTRRLKKSFAEVQEYREHLESQVNKRTENLRSEIQQRRQTEEELRKSSERLNNIFQQSSMGIVVFDNKFNVVEWNPGCEKIFGYSRDEIIGRPASIIVPEEQRGNVTELFDSLMRGNKSIKNQNENCTRDNRRILCDWYNTPLTDSSHNTVGMLSLVEDVTERMHAEKELLKVKKLESTGVLAGGIAHDFNNLLTAILGSINLVMLDDTLSPRSMQLMANAEKASKRAQALTQQLLTFAKGGAPIREQTSIADVIMDSADFILRGSSTSVTYELADDLWLVDADKGQISQVIQNIVLNASQATPSGGNIRISCENFSKNKAAETPLLDEIDYVKLTIRDNGVGMPQQVLERIFDPYFSTKSEGSGLGLAITLSIIRKHNGHITAASTPDSGTTFTIFLPASLEPITPETLPEFEETTGKPATILLMDDEQMILDVVEEMIRALGHTAYFAKNGEQCLQVYKQLMEEGSPPDLVIMDLTIPGGKGGEETFYELQTIDPDIKAIVSSGYSNNPLMSRYRKAGFYGAISKPYVTEELSRVIQMALQTSTHP